MPNKLSKLLEHFRPAGYRGNMMLLFSKLLKIGIINTLRFNQHYFGWHALFRPVALLSRGVKLRCLQGTVRLETPSAIGLLTIGLNSNGISPNGTVAWENTGSIILKGACHFGPGSRIVNAGTLTLGGKNESIRFNGNVSLICYHRICIGEGTAISWDTLIMDTDLHKIYRKSDYAIANENRPIHIGKHCWIGCRTLILKGAYIPDYSIIAASSVITKKLEESYTVYISNNPIKKEVAWE